MKLSINYSPVARDLLLKHQINVDLFKVPDWLDLIEEAGQYHPVSVHFPLEAGDGSLVNTDWEKVTRLAEQTNTYYINLHLESSRENYPDMPFNTPEKAQFDRVVGDLLNDTRLAVERYGAERVIVENLPYHGAEGIYMLPASLPDVIREVVESTGCGLLLDISHARISARTLGMDERDYLNALPVDHLRELHFAGIHWLDGRWVDHLGVQDEDWTMLAWVLERIRKGDWQQPWMLAFEYGGVGDTFNWRSDPKVIADQTPRLYEMVNEV